MNRSLEIPYDSETEQILIALMIREPAVMDYAQLSASDFFISIYQKIYSVIEKLHKKGESWTIDGIHTELRDDYEFLKYGGIALLEGLFYNAIPSVNEDVVKGYCAKLKKMSALRRIIGLSSEITEMAYLRNDPEKIFEVFDEKMQLIKSKYNDVVREVKFTKLRIVTSNPRAYYLFVDPPGQEIALTIQQIRNPRTVQMMIQNHFDFIPRMPKNWLDKLNELMLHAEKVPPPQDAIFEYRIRKTILEYFSQAGEGEYVEDLRGYMYVCKDNYRCFYVRQLIKWMETVEKIKVTPFQLWNIMEKWGCIKDKRIRLNKTTTVWALPESFFEEDATSETYEESETTVETTRKTTAETATETTVETAPDVIVETAVDTMTETTTNNSEYEGTKKQSIFDTEEEEDDFGWLSDDES